MARPFKNLSMVHGILSKSHFSHMVCFCASFPQFLIKCAAHLLFHFLHHTNVKRTHTLPFLIQDCIRLREARVRVLQQRGQDISEHALKKLHPWVPVHIGEPIPIQILFACLLYILTLGFPDQNSVWIYYSAMCATYLTNLVKWERKPTRCNS